MGEAKMWVEDGKLVFSVSDFFNEAVLKQFDGGLAEAKLTVQGPNAVISGTVFPPESKSAKLTASAEKPKPKKGK